MKTIKTVILTLMIGVSSASFAQLSHPGAIDNSNSEYNRVELSYAPVSWDVKGADIDDWSGVKFGYLHGKSVSQSIPIYLEYGISAQYAWFTEEGYKDDITSSVVNITVPLNIAYKFAVNNDFSITPYVGLHVRGNIIGQSSDGDDTLNYFSKSDMGGSSGTANRVQLGGQIGIGIDYKTFYVGVGYNTQFSDYFKKTKTAGYTVTVGLNV